MTQQVVGSLSSVNLHHPKIMMAGDTSGPTKSTIFFIAWYYLTIKNFFVLIVLTFQIRQCNSENICSGYKWWVPRFWNIDLWWIYESGGYLCFNCRRHRETQNCCNRQRYQRKLAFVFVFSFGFLFLFRFCFFVVLCHSVCLIFHKSQNLVLSRNL